MAKKCLMKSTAVIRDLKLYPAELELMSFDDNLCSVIIVVPNHFKSKLKYLKY